MAPRRALANEPAGGTGGIVFVFGGVPCGALPKSADHALHGERRGVVRLSLSATLMRRRPSLTPSVDANPPLCDVTLRVRTSAACATAARPARCAATCGRVARRRQVRRGVRGDACAMDGGDCDAAASKSLTLRQRGVRACAGANGR